MKITLSLTALAIATVLAVLLFPSSEEDFRPEGIGLEVAQASNEQLQSGKHVGSSSESAVAAPAAQRVSVSASSVAEIQEQPAAFVKRGVTIQVVDESGQALRGVRVCIGSTKGKFHLWSGLTEGETGTVETGTEWLNFPVSTSSVGTLYASLDGPFFRGEAVLINPYDLPKEAIVFVLPSSRGSLEVRCVDEQGAAVPAHSVYLESSRATQGPKLFWGNEAEEGSGIFRVDAIGLDQTLTIRGRARSLWGSSEGRFTGPTTSGEQRVVELVFQRLEPSVTGSIRGQLTRKGGASLASDGFVSSTIVAPDRGASNGMLGFNVSADGHFFAAMPSGFEAGERCEFLFRPTMEEDLGSHYLGRAIHAAPGPGQVVDLGWIELEEDQEGFSGFVLDDRSDPISGASVIVQRTDNATIPSITRVGENFPMTVSLNDGSFSLPPLPSEGKYHLVVHKAGYVMTEPVPVETRTTGIVLDMKPALVIAGLALLPKGIRPSQIALNLYQVRGEQHGPNKRITLRDDGTFEEWNLSTGPYRLTVVDSTSRQVVFRTPEIHPWVEGKQADGALNPLDLRGKLVAFSFRAESPDGEPVDIGYASTGEEAYLMVDGHCEGVIAPEALRLRIFGRGFRPQEFEVSQIPALVTLQPGIPVRLLAPSPWPDTIPRERAFAYLHPIMKEQKGMSLTSLIGVRSKTGSLVQADALPASFAESDQVDITVPLAGKYMIRWFTPATDPIRMDLGIANVPPQFVEITESDQVQLIQLSTK